MAAISPAWPGSTTKVADGLPPAHTDRHIHPNKTAAEHAARARLAAFNRSTAGVRLEMPGRSDLFAERMINAQGFKNGLNGEYLWTPGSRYSPSLAGRRRSSRLFTQGISACVGAGLLAMVVNDDAYWLS